MSRSLSERKSKNAVVLLAFSLIKKTVLFFFILSIFPFTLFMLLVAFAVDIDGRDKRFHSNLVIAPTCDTVSTYHITDNARDPQPRLEPAAAPQTYDTCSQSLQSS